MNIDNLFQKILGNKNSFHEELNKFKDELKAKIIVGAAGGGMVEVTINGSFNIIDIKIEDVCYSDTKMLCELIKAATNDAISKAYELLKEEMSKTYSQYINPFHKLNIFNKE